MFWRYVDGWHAGEASAVGHEPVGHREPCSAVVELGPARESGAAREKDRRAVDGERRNPRRGGPPSRSAVAPRPGDDDSGDGNSSHDPGGEARRLRADRDELGDHDDARETRRQEERPRRVPAADSTRSPQPSDSAARKAGTAPRRSASRSCAGLGSIPPDGGCGRPPRLIPRRRGNRTIHPAEKNRCPLRASPSSSRVSTRRRTSPSACGARGRPSTTTGSQAR